MNKDVIYIDIEDDITAVIDKVKNSSQKIVALVPPKGNAVLQSVVNLKLLKRAANSASKQPVIVTSNAALTALAGGLELYVAKNLQSKPAIPNTESVPADADEEVNVDDEVTVDAGATAALSSTDDESDEVELSSDELAALDAENQSEQPVKKSKDTGKKKPSKKIPNFDSFRKKLLIGGGIALLLLIIAVAVFGRAKSSIVIRAETTPVDVAFDMQVNAGASSSDPESFSLKGQLQEKKQTISQSFTPTGQKDIGEKASGKVRFFSNDFMALFAGINIPAGTTVTSSSGKKFTTDETVRLTATSGGNQKNVDVTAAESGPSFNGASGSASGGPSSVSVSFVGSTSGGTSQVVKVVSQDDVNKARTQLDQQDTNAIKEELTKAFGDNVTILDDSFTAVLANVRSEPVVGEQANEARLTADATYSLLAVTNDDLGAAIDSFITSQMTNKDQQRVYENGLDRVRLEKISQDGGVAAYKVTTLAYYGPQFDTEKLKEEVAGKKFGEARAYLQDLPGVKGVDINLSPFWARTLPGAGRIEIKLDVDQATRG